MAGETVAIAQAWPWRHAVGKGALRVSEEGLDRG